MIFDPKNEDTWPRDGQDVLIHSSEIGFTVGSFYAEEMDDPGFGDWFDRIGDAEDADYCRVIGAIQWWPLPAIERDNTRQPDGGKHE